MSRYFVEYREANFVSAEVGMSREILKRQAEKLCELAKVVFVLADEQLGEGKWSRLVFDYRVTASGTQAMYQFRALTPDGLQHLSTDGTAEITVDLHDLRGKLPGEPWYGFCLVMRSDGKVHVKYDYDKDCLDGILEDTSFYEDLL